MKHRIVQDLSGLPTYAFGSRSPLWWGTLGFVAIEGTGFAIALVVYFYLRMRVEQWPPDLPPPDPLFGTFLTVVLLVSLWPNQWTKRAAERGDLRRVRIGLLIGVAVGLALLVLRAFEFTSLNVWWDANAYGSIVWIMLGLHTTHLLTDIVDTMVLTALMFTGPLKKKRFVDVSENSFYWNFVVAAWIPIYAVLYFGPRLM